MASYRYAVVPKNWLQLKRGRSQLHLPVRIRPFPGESGISYLIRLAWANGYDSSAPIACRLQRLAAKPAKLRAVLHLSKEEWGKLFLPWPKRFRPADAQTPDHKNLVLNYATVRWCPICLREAAFLDARWSVRLYCICPYHYCSLMDACPTCGAEPTAAQVLGGHCTSCGQLLTEKVLNTTEEVKVVQSHFQLAREREEQQTLTMTPAGWERLVQFMASVEFRYPKQKTGQLAQLHRIHVLTPVCHRLGQLLANWPYNFWEWLDSVKASAPSSFSLNRTFGRIYHWFYVELDGPEFHYWREAFEEYLRHSWEGLITQRNRRQKNLRHQPGCISLQGACLKLRITPAELKRLYYAGWLDAHVVTMPSGRTFWSIPEKQLPEVMHELDEGLTLQATARYLGISKVRTRVLAETPWLKPQLCPGEFGSTVWRFPLYTISTLLARCQASGQSACQPTGVVRLRTALKTMRIDDQCFVALVDAIATHQIACVSTGEKVETLGDITLDASSLSHWLQQRRAMETGRLTIAEAATRLGIKEQVAYQLIRNGKLASVEEGKTRRWVEQAALEQFAEAYVSLAELAKGQDTSPKALLAQLPVRPVIGPPIDGCRQYFFRKEDVESLLISKGVDQPCRNRPVVPLEG